MPEKEAVSSKEFIRQDIVQVNAIVDPDFHLQGKEMISYLELLTEAAGMKQYGRAVALDKSNYQSSPDAIDHPLGGSIRPNDENGYIPWRDSWCSVCVYNGTRDEAGVQISITAHSCGEMQIDRFLRFIFTSLDPLRMEQGRLSSINEETHEFRTYELSGDEPFKQIAELLNANPQRESEKLKLGQQLESIVFSRRNLENREELQDLDQLLLKHEMEKLQTLFCDYEGILESETAQEIISAKSLENAEKALETFPYYERYDQLTDTELSRSEASQVESICMIGGGELPISALMYAMKTNAHIHVVEKDSERADISRKVVEKLGLDKRITIINQQAKEVEYRKMNVIIMAAMADPKWKILQQTSKTSYARTIIIRTPLGDNRVFYQGMYLEDLLGPIGTQLNHGFRPGCGVQGEPADSDGVFSLLYLDHKSALELN